MVRSWTCWGARSKRQHWKLKVKKTNASACTLEQHCEIVHRCSEWNTKKTPNQCRADADLARKRNTTSASGYATTSKVSSPWPTPNCPSQKTSPCLATDRPLPYQSPRVGIVSVLLPWSCWMPAALTVALTYITTVLCDHRWCGISRCVIFVKVNIFTVIICTTQGCCISLACHGCRLRYLQTISRVVSSTKGPCKRATGLGIMKDIPSGKLTCQWKLTVLNRRYIFKWWISHCYVSLRECEGALSAR